MSAPPTADPRSLTLPPASLPPCLHSLPCAPCLPPALQTSLAQFNELYEGAIDAAERAPLPARRIHNILDHMTHEVFLYTQRGLFERHKLIFALMLANKILVRWGWGRGWGLVLGGCPDVCCGLCG